MKDKSKEKTKQSTKMQGVSTNTYDIALTIAFIIVISAPLLFAILGIEDRMSTEKRELTGMPVLKDISFNGDLMDELRKVAAFKHSFEKYFEENFFLRNSFIAYNNYLKLRLLGYSDNPKVIYGHEGWMFLGNYAGSLEYYRNLNPLTDNELKIIADKLTAREKWLSSRGIIYIVVFCPNKETIYSEYFPERFRKAGNVSELDSIVEHLKENTNIRFVDMRDVFRTTKNNYSLYPKTGTHWNDLGAYLTYKKIMDQILKANISKPVKILGLNDYNVVLHEVNGSDLAYMLSVHTFIKDKYISFEPKSEVLYESLQPESLRTINGPGLFTAKNMSGEANAVIFKDSFMEAMVPFISSSFSNVTYVWTYDFNESLIEEEMPEVVITEIVERNVRMALLVPSK